MIIVSNSSIPNRTEQKMSYDEFKEKAYSGLEIDDVLIINVDDIEEEVFNDLKSAEVLDSIKFFRTSNFIPSFIDVKVEDWSNNSSINSINESNTFKETLENLLDDSSYNDELPESETKDAKVYVFGSSKGGTGKTFTAVMSTYRYAKTHPHEKIALVDFDIIDGQVGISIHKIKPTVRNYLTEYQKGYRDFRTLQRYAIKANDPFPQNVDFYLAPNSGSVIDNDDFWLNILQLCQENYDVVVFDTGIDYLNIKPISYAYKMADKINLVTTTSIKSVNSVTKQISKLKGEVKNPIYSVEDDISPRLNIIITQMVDTNEMNKTIYHTLSAKCNVIATFGVITSSVMSAEFYGLWDVFDNNPGINQAFDDIMSL